jgi:hypothetical protein
MKKSSKIRSVKTLILSQLLLGTLSVSADPLWNWHQLHGLHCVLATRWWRAPSSDPRNPLQELKDIVQYTYATTEVLMNSMQYSPVAEKILKMITKAQWRFIRKIQPFQPYLDQDQFQDATIDRIYQKLPKYRRKAQHLFNIASQIYHTSRNEFEQNHPADTGSQ